MEVPTADPHLARLVHLLRAYDPERSIQFGSYARGEADEYDEYSDYDIVVIKRTERPFLARLRDVVPHVAGFDRPVDILVYTPEEFEAMGEQGLPWLVRREGIVLYEKRAA